MKLLPHFTPLLFFCHSLSSCTQVIDVLLLHSHVGCMELALRQPGIDAASLCRLLRFCVTWSLSHDEDAHSHHRDDHEDADGVAPEASPAAVSPTPRRLLYQIVSTPVREESLRGALKTLPAAEIDDALDWLLAAGQGEGEEEETPEETQEEEGERPDSAIPRAALFRWITLLIDAHFFHFVVGGDERRARLLRQAESLVQDVQAYFATRDGLDALMDRMRQRALILRGKGAPLKTQMGPEEDYCIQIFEI